MKALKEVQKFNQLVAKTKCEDIGGFIFTPMNEKYTEDLEALLLSNPEFKGTDFWIGKKQQCLYSQGRGGTKVSHCFTE